MIKYIKTAQLSALEKLNGGIAFLLPDIFIKVCTLIPLLYLWRVVMASGAEVGMSVEQMLGYTTMSSLLADLLVVKTAASGWLSEGVLLKLYGRPLPVLGQLVAQTIGGWFPMLMLFSLPMAVLAPLFGAGLIPASPLFALSLFLCVTLGFAVDFLFACLTIKLRNVSWLVGRMRMAIAAVFSGTVIPIQLMPFGLDAALKHQPFAYLGGATLSIYVGAAEPVETIALQIFWNLVLWPLALFIWNKSQEGVVSYGG